MLTLPKPDNSDSVAICVPRKTDEPTQATGPGPRSSAPPAPEPEDPAGVRRLDPPLRALPRQAPSPGDGAEEIRAFLPDLAVHRRVSASTQNQAFSALFFLYRGVLRIPLPRIERSSARRSPGACPWCLRAQRPPRCWLVAGLLDGSGKDQTPMSSFHRDGCSRMKLRIISMQRGSCSTSTVTPRLRSNSSSPVNVVFSPTITRGIR
jgi:hypothetical protein